MQLMSEKEKHDMIILLKKQRDGLIIGDYRNMLYYIYHKIYSSVLLEKQTCSIKDILETMPVNYRNKNQLLELCNVLKELGYIDIHHTSNNITFSILKEIDF